METLKSLTTILEPDRRNEGFSVFDQTLGAFRQRTFEDLHTSLSSVQLHGGVPSVVRSHFATALNLVAYSWYFYPFNVAAELMGHVSIEFALRERFNADISVPFKVLVRRAVNEGLIRERGFSHYSEPRTDHLPPQLEDIYRPHPESEYLSALIEAVPSVRNSLAHGSKDLHFYGLRSVRFCAEFINQLFAVPSDA